MRRVFAVVYLLLTFTLTPHHASGQDTSALVNEALDKLVELDVQRGTVLPEAMKQIADTYGVPIEAEPVVWDLLPWGEQTTIEAQIKNQSLREALTAITRTLGLTFEVKDEFVQLQPMPALRRLGRRSTVEELQALDLLASTPMQLKGEQTTVRQLLAAVDQKLVNLNSPYAVENRASDAVGADHAVYVPRNVTVAEALESLVKDTNATWYPWGKSIVVVAKEDQIRNQLAKTLSLRYDDADVSQVLTELSQRSGVSFSIEPGAIQRIPPEFRTIRLRVDNASVKSALENIAGFTGLGYVVRDEGVYIWHQTNQTAPPRDPTIGLIPLDNGMELMVRESEIPEDLRQYLQHRKQKEFDKLRAMMEEEGFKPTTRPTTEPAEDL